VIHRLRELVEDRRFDVLHGYEWPPALEAWFATSKPGCPAVAVATVMSMAVAPFLPGTIPLVVGTKQIAEWERRRGRRRITTIEPPVDLTFNDPTAECGRLAFETQYNISSEDLTVVTVTRLAHELKLEGLLTAIETISTLAEERPARLLIVGDGPARDTVQLSADRVNARARREIVTLTGEMSDPRPAYATGDVHLAMGSSALRALSFAKPVIVQGERGFFALMTPENLPDFEWAGWYGIGPSIESGPAQLRQALDDALDPEFRGRLGRFGRVVAERNYSLEAATERQIAVYQEALALPDTGGMSPTSLTTFFSRYGAYALSRRVARLVGTARSDDFNSRPVAVTGPARPGQV
jgi:glycosyltransferase involved in cell wall biosynthesis